MASSNYYGSTFNNARNEGFYLQAHREVAQIWTREDTSLGIMRWGWNNTFPQSLVNLIEQSANAKPAVKRTAQFYRGGSFEGENTIVSPYGLTLKKVVSIMADDYANWEAFALQVNYNIKGQVTSINPMRIAELRFNRFDELNYASKIGYHQDFGHNAVVHRTISQTVNRDNIRWFDRFNPDVVEQQIKKTEGGIGNYLGQMLYHSEAGHSSYPISPLQAPVNYLLSDVENSILIRKETSTGFINSYVLKTTMDSEDASLIAMEDAIADAQGARGSGKIITFSGLSSEEVQSTLLEEIGAGGAGSKAVIEAATMTFELDQRVLSGAYLIPPALAGVDNSTGFSGEDLKEAYFTFNAITQNGRNTIENELNRILENSIFKTKSIKLNKLTLDLNEEEVDEPGVDDTEGGEPTASANKVFTDMSGRQMQNLQRVVRKFNKGQITEPQARQMLEGFGLNNDQINVWLTPQEDV
jgi:hypothetical protein